VSNDKRVFISLGIVAGVVVSFLLVCGSGLVFVVNTIHEKNISEFEAEIQRETDEIIARFDANKNGIWDGGEVSTAIDELYWIKRTTDTNSDGEIDPKELAAAMMTTTDANGDDIDPESFESD
jgi:hypothetical protein